MQNKQKQEYKAHAERLAAANSIRFVRADQVADEPLLQPTDPDWPQRLAAYKHDGDYRNVAMSRKAARIVVTPMRDKEWTETNYFAVLHEMGHIVAGLSLANGEPLSPGQMMRDHQLIEEEARAWAWALDNALHAPSPRVALEAAVHGLGSYLMPQTADGNMNDLPFEEGVCPQAVAAMDELLEDAQAPSEKKRAFHYYVRQMNDYDALGDTTGVRGA